ncbi:hypothetical protein BYT27DRAFT_6858134 [Phlegmacium glaucopus]|nr:hypothetical protein BYT27DRAFT_6858134 [Phlegmacium glaucopus]
MFAGCLNDHNCRDLTSTQCYFIVASKRDGKSPIVSPNSSTIHLVSFSPLADASSAAAYLICIL